MSGCPTADELLEAVGEFLAALAGRVDPADAFLLKVTGNVLQTVRRDMAGGAALAVETERRFAALLGETGAAEHLTRRLCDALRSGRIAPDDPVLLGHLQHLAVAQLAIDNPRYATYRRIADAVD